MGSSISIPPHSLDRITTTLRKGILYLHKGLHNLARGLTNAAQPSTLAENLSHLKIHIPWGHLKGASIWILTSTKPLVQKISSLNTITDLIFSFYRLQTT